jgi:multisubunit Na+/H+ antiporter MnhB subunit
MTSPTYGKEPTRRAWSLAPWLSRLVMFLAVIIFTVINLRYFTNPAHATAGTTLNTPEAFADTRVIGAWTLTLLVMLITFLLSETRLWLGHLQLVVFMAVTLAVRILGLTHDSTTLAVGYQRMITIVEIALLSLSAVGFVLQTYLRKQAMVSQ